MSIGIVAALILSLLVAWLVVSPLFEPVPSSIVGTGSTDSLRPLLDSKERALRALKDLEMDFSMGKVSQEDFEQAKGTLTAEVVAIMNDIKRSGGGEAGA